MKIFCDAPNKLSQGKSAFISLVLDFQFVGCFASGTRKFAPTIIKVLWGHSGADPAGVEGGGSNL